MPRTPHPLLLLCAAALTLSACAADTTRRPAMETVPAALHQEDASAALQSLGQDYWAALMRRYPTWATHMGQRQYDELLYDASPEAIEAHNEELRAFQRRLEALDLAALSPQERITAEVLSEELRAALSYEVCQDWLWKVDQLSGPQLSFAELPNGHPLTAPEHAWTLVARYEAMGPALKQYVANLRQGLAQGLVAPRINVERVIRQLEALLMTPSAQSPWMVLPMKQLQRRGLDPAQMAGPRGEPLEAALLQATEAHIYPGMRELLWVLRGEVLPAAREQVGVSALPMGAACYEARKRGSTGSEQSAAQIHQVGLQEVARIQQEMIELLGDELQGQPLADWLAKLGGSTEQGFASREALLDYNRQLVARAQAELPRAFDRLPATPLEVRALEPFVEKDAPAAYYYGAPRDGSRPAIYYVNAYQPQKRPRYTMAVLAFHEAVPGHHLQIALASEQEDLPLFQREVGQTAFVEGWGLYAERLAGELGLYRDRDEKLGALVYEMWRAVRLVVDTGMHTQGWSRQKALDYLMEHTGKDIGEASNEIDRYIVWPGQALAYKIGQLEILALRQEARQALGERFSLPAFHAAVLGSGAVPMPTLRRMVRAWIQEQLKAPGAAGRGAGRSGEEAAGQGAP